MKQPFRLGVAITSFNRRDKTKACLDGLFRSYSQLSEPVTLIVALTDDGSSDGTAEMVVQYFPQVVVLPGTGGLYWAGGMRLALAHLYKLQLDAYLWLNDDTILDADALPKLLAAQSEITQEWPHGAIVVGTTRDSAGHVSYGGLRRRPHRLGGLSFERVIPGAENVSCETHNGNVVLVSSGVVTMLGNLDGAFRHGMADIDYGLRATSAGIPIRVMPSYAGVCDKDHPVAGSFLDQKLPLLRRLRLIVSPKGLPIASWRILCRRHAGRLWLFHFSWPYIHTVLTSILSFPRRVIGTSAVGNIESV